jgi:hypothetical protein
MIHSSKYLPRIFPIFVDDTDAELDRIQDLNSTLTLNRTKVQEVGRTGIVAWRKTTPSVTVNAKQFEYGNIELYRKLANKGPTVSQINFSDFTTSSFDIAGYKTDDSGTFLGTIWYPSLRLTGMSLNIGDPQAVIERSFSMVGENEIALLNNNKYLIRQRYVIGTTGNNRTVSISNPTPTADPDNSGKYLLRVVKISGGTASELDWGTEWSYNGAGTLTINGSSTLGDVIVVWFSASSLGSQTTFTQNDADLSSITAESCSIYLANNQYLYRLQSASLEVTLNRRDIREIGNDQIVARGVQDINTRVTVGKIIESYTIEEVLRGKVGQSYGIIDPINFTDNFQLVVKIYQDSTKTASQFLIGYKLTDLAPTGRNTGTPVNDYITAGVTMEGQEGFITTVNAVL